MSESLYCSLLMLSLGILTLFILRGGALASAGASFAIAGCMLTRPAGFFIFGAYGLVLGWLLFRRRPRRHVLAYLLPIAIVFLASCTDPVSLPAHPITIRSNRSPDRLRSIRCRLP